MSSRCCLSRARFALLGTIRGDGEELEGALLDRSWSGVEREDVFVVERGGRLDPCIGGEVGQQALEAMHRQAVVGEAGGLLAPGGFGALGLGNDGSAHGGGRLVIGLVVQHRRKPGAHVVLDMIGEHAQYDVGAHARRRPMEVGRRWISMVFNERIARSTRARLL
jgi:hypothetical protein